MQERIIWIGGYPHVDGVNTPAEPPLEELLIDDVLWEAQMKAAGVTGMALTEAFLARLGKKQPQAPVGKPQEVPPIRKAEVEKKHIKKSGK